MAFQSGRKKRTGPRFAKSFNAINRDPRIGIGAKALYSVIKGYANSNGHCHPSIALLCECLNSTRKSVLKWLGELLTLRIITRAPRYIGNVQTTSDYLIDDEHFAKHLARPPAGVKKTPARWGKKDTTEVEPLNKSKIIKLPNQKTA